MEVSYRSKNSNESAGRIATATIAGLVSFIVSLLVVGLIQGILVAIVFSIPYLGDWLRGYLMDPYVLEVSPEVERDRSSFLWVMGVIRFGVAYYFTMFICVERILKNSFSRYVSWTIIGGVVSLYTIEAAVFAEERSYADFVNIVCSVFIFIKNLYSVQEYKPS